MQVQVATEVPGRSPDEVERMVTVPVEIGMTGLPGMTEMRSQNEPGLSIVTLVFTDDTPLYFARQIVSERLSDVRSRLPEGLVPVMGPVSTALSEVYQYTLDNPSDGQRALKKEELVQRRIIQDWVARPLLRSIPGRSGDQLDRRICEAVSGPGGPLPAALLPRDHQGRV